ncbi:uncharacterized protein LOC115784225 isoform X2 [Archocentrus centrarchus]|uniref:uncharacterized protein LOC115784225 isoform X2 n=1 Tax=Archocentrus centrarchus TaxID=63155 RepID=UPI0011E9E8E8|nr:uncharacterized protein LOC115784225 isoform X2 [Archocentrus centrarchus]
MLHKSTGGSGRRNLVVIPPDLHGYTGQQLKVVTSSGKYTLYICPLQEELDTIPLPPEAKEFEKMPKAQCTTCKKMVPLQILPVHIKECKTELVDLSCSAEEESCKEHDEFRDSTCNQSDQTSECPVCNNAFHVDIIEVHAATCGLRPSDNDCHESSGSGAVGQISTFQSRGMQQWQRQKKTSPKSRLKVTFFGEAGIDTGALSREFLTEMLAEVENRLFVGGSDKKGKNPVYCLNSLDSNFFRSVGEIMAASLAQGGPCPNFLRDWCFRYLCSGDSDSIQVSASDVTDFELSQLIERINSTDDDKISDLVDDIVTCGYTGILSMERRDAMIRWMLPFSWRGAALSLVRLVLPSTRKK